MDKSTTYRRIVFIVAITLLVVVIVCQILPLTFSESDLIGQSALQGMRAQKIAKDALTLEYRPENAHIQAISEIQNTLPVWEAEQKQLLNTHNNDMQTLLNQAQPDYTAIDTATTKLLMHPDDLTQVQIILQHERNYSLLMSQVSMLIQARIESFNLDLIITQIVISTLIAATVIVLFVLSRQTKTAKKEEVANGQA